MIKENWINLKQDNLYHLLKMFDTFCATNGINYFLAAGSLLGAVKYQDFVPWDDDLDIYMLRTDYELLLSKLHTLNQCDMHIVKVFFNDRLVLRDEKTWEDFIDISVLDAAPDWPATRKLITNLQLLLRSCLYDRVILDQNNFLLKMRFICRYTISRVIRIMINKKTIYKLQKYVSTLFNTSQKAQLYLSSSDTRYLCTRFPKSWFETKANYKFRDGSYPSVEDANEYLQQQYGDISKLPPHNLRIPQHIGLSKHIYDFYSD